MTQASNPDFQNYLQSVCDRYKCWQRFYTSTDVQGTKQSKSDNEKPYFPIDFGQIVKSVPTKQPQEEQKQEKIEQLPVLEGICKYAPNHVLLIQARCKFYNYEIAQSHLLELNQNTLDISIMTENSSRPKFNFPQAKNVVVFAHFLKM